MLWVRVRVGVRGSVSLSVRMGLKVDVSVRVTYCLGSRGAVAGEGITHAVRARLVCV